jgi:Flp pilus assembly protein TadD
MAARPYRACPQCGARNKLDWDFCGRCGETLERVTPQQRQGATEISPAPASSRPASVAGAAALVAACGLAVWLWPRGPETRPDPGVFTLPSAPEARATLPADEPGALDLGRARLARGDYAEALPRLREAVAAAPESAGAWLALAKALWHTDEREEALSAFASAARLAPGEVTTYELEYARALEASGQADSARAGYERVLARTPSEPDALQGLGRLLTQSGRAGEALPLLQRAAAAKPDDPRLATELGMAYERSGDDDAAVAHYRAVVERFPAAAYPQVALADALSRQGHADEALELMRAAVTRRPADPLLQRGLGTALERRGDSRGAAAAYREYLRLDPGAPDAAQVQARAAALDPATAATAHR